MSEKHTDLTFDDFLTSEMSTLAKFTGVLVGDRQSAHDVLIDALVVVCRKWGLISSKQHVGAYVRQVIVRTFLSERRKYARRKTWPSDQPCSNSSMANDETDRVETLQFLHVLLATLPSRQRAAVVMRYYLDYDDATISKVMGISPNGVRSNISRALATLRTDAEIVDLKKGTLR